MQGMQVHKWIVNVMGRSLWLVALLCLLQGATAVCGVVYALLMRDAVDAAVTGVPSDFMWALAAFAGVVLVQVLLGTTNRYASERARASTENRLRAAAFSTALKQDVRKASARHSGELMTRFTSDVSAVLGGAVSFVPRAVFMVVRIASVLIAMVALSPQLAAAFVVLGCAIAGVSASLRGTVWVFAVEELDPENPPAPPEDPEPGDPEPGDPEPGDPEPGKPTPGDPDPQDPWLPVTGDNAPVLMLAGVDVVAAIVALFAAFKRRSDEQ